MTTEVLTPAPPYVIAGTGPYPVPHPYQSSGELVVGVLEDGVLTLLAMGTHYTVSPAKAPSGTGAVTLKAAIAASRAGDKLIVTRATTAEQGWQGVNGPREKGLELQLDRIVQVLQDLVGGLGRALKIPVGSTFSTLVSPPRPGRTLVVSPDGGRFVEGPALQDLVDLALRMLAAAHDIVAQGNVPLYAYAEALEGCDVPEGLQAAHVQGWAALGDGRGGWLERRASEPADTIGKVQSADGDWWEVATADVAEDARGASFVLSRPVSAHAGGDLGASPASAPYFNVIAGHGTKFTGQIWRSTIVGALAGTMLESAERVEAIGNGAMRFARWGNRSTAIGSLSQQWLGQEKSRLTELYHDLWWPVPPTDPAWDAGGLETSNPGVRLKLVAAAEAEGPDDVRGNVSLGRDSLLHLIKGVWNTAGGYRALTQAVNATDCTAFGRDALRDNVLADYNTALGSAAGALHQEGNVNVYVGYTAGLGHVTGLGNTFLGGAAGDEFANANRNVLIGYTAGRGTALRDDVLAIQNLAIRKPLIAGNFATGRAGINLLPEEIMGRWHIRAGTDPSGATPLSAASHLLVESTSSCGMSFLTTNAAIARILFADPQNNEVGGILYDHSSDTMSLRASNVIKVQVNASGLKVVALPTSASGLSTGQVWNDGGTLKVAA